MKEIYDAMGRNSLFVGILTLCLFAGADVAEITAVCTFSSATEIVVSDILGRNVCIRRADTDPESVNVRHFIICSGANTFRSSGDTGNAVLCQNYMGRSGIGVDFESEAATVESLDLVCENSTGTTTEVNEIKVYIRPDKSIEYLSQSDDGTVDAVIGKTTVIAKFVGLIDDLRKVDVPAGVNCNTMTENNCRFASDGFESELTMTCTVTPQSLDIGREKIFTRRNTTETLAHVMVNVIPNTTGTTPTIPPTELGVGGKVGIGVGVPAVVILFIIALLIIIFIGIWCAGPGTPSHQNDSENGGEVPTPNYNYVAFGQGISDKVQKAIMNLFNADEYKLNGRSVEERFGEGSDRVLCVTSRGEYASTSEDASSSLTAQMRQLEDNEPGGRVHVVQIPDEILSEVEGAEDTDDVSPVVGFVTEQLPRQPANRHYLQRQSSTDSRVLVAVQSLQRTMHSVHRIVFNSRVEANRTDATNDVTSAASLNGAVISEVDNESPSPALPIPNGQVTTAEVDL